MICISTRKIKENIAKLKEIGLIKRIGPARGGYWEVIISIGGTQQALKNYSSFLDKKIDGKNTYCSFKENLETF